MFYKNILLFYSQIEADPPFIITNKVMSEMDLYNNSTTNIIYEIISLADGKHITMEYLTEGFMVNVTKIMQSME